MWCAAVADYCNVLDRVLPVPVLPGGRANRWQWWGTVRLLGMTLRYGEIVATFRVPYNPAEGITLDGSTTLSSVSDALARQKLAGGAVDLDRLATETQVRTLQLTSSKEPKVARLAARLGKVRLPIERPPVVVVDGMRVDLWIDSSSDDSLAYSTLNPTKDLAAWVEDLREFLIEHFEAAEREQLAPQ
jgi:hypothetical protein